MGWFSKLFGLKRQGPNAGNTAKAAANDQNILHWKFTATLKASTPLEWLLQHGQTAEAPIKVPQKFGVWVPVTNSLRELVFRSGRSPSSTIGSQVGQIPQDGGEFLPLLIEYRQIVEAPDNGINALRLDALKERSPQYAHVLESKPKKNKRKTRR